jgi:hypothetical protein
LRLFIIAIGIMAAVIPIPPEIVEHRYSTTLYPHLQHALTASSNTASFAVFDAFLILSAAAMLMVLLRRQRIRNILALASTVWLLFLLTWGLNYRRLPLSERLDFGPERVGPPRIGELAVRAVSELNKLHGPGHANPWPERDELVERLKRPFETARTHLAIGPVLPAQPKRSILDGYFRMAAIDGMTDPLFLEVLVSSDVLPFERPAVVAHEWGHVAGFANEAEASFLAWLTCISGDPQLQYSGWLTVYPRLVANLPEKERQAVSARLAVGPRADLQQVAERLRAATPAVHEMASRAYDRFLKGNRVEEGIQSYGGVVRLMAGTRFKEGFVPVLR